jgi:hypothetical protein
MEENVRKLAATIFICFMVVSGIGCKRGDFSIKRLDPDNGAINGGDMVEIVGSGFGSGQGVAVYFGTFKVNNVVVKGAEKMVVSTPQVPEPQVVDVRIVMDDGQEFVLRKAFRYLTKGAIGASQESEKKSRRVKAE